MPAPRPSSASDPMQPLSNVLPLPERRSALPSEVSPDDVAGVVQCESHGQYLLRYVWVQGRRYTPAAACPQCKAARELREAQERDAAVSRFEVIPPLFADATFNSFRPVNDTAADIARKCFAYARDFKDMRERGECLALIGNYGTGKTHLAHCIARAVRRQGYRVLYATAADIIMTIRDTWGRSEGPRESEVLAQFAEADLLIMDEVGQQQGTRGEEVHIFHLINRRAEAELPTVVLSNLAVDGVKRFLTEPGFDRLRGRVGLQLLTFGWDSQRGVRR